MSIPSKLELRTLDTFREPLVEWSHSRFGVYFSGRVEAESTRTLNAGGEPEVLGDDSYVAGVPEHELVPFLIRVPSTRTLLLEALGMPPEATWFWIDEKRENLLREAPSGKPGDFDVICGVVRGDTLSTEFLCAVEVKRRRVDQAGRAKQFPSGTGTAQVDGLVNLGFDRSLLLHCLVSENTQHHPDALSTWQGMMNARTPQAAAATVNKVRASLPSGAGQMVLMIGQGHQRDYRRSHTAIAHVSAVPATTPRRESQVIVDRRALLSAAVERRLGPRRPGRFFRSGSSGRIVEETLY